MTTLSDDARAQDAIARLLDEMGETLLELYELRRRSARPKPAPVPAHRLSRARVELGPFRVTGRGYGPVKPPGPLPPELAPSERSTR